MFSNHELNLWRLLAYIIAFGIAAGVGAILIFPAYHIFEHDTDTPAEARDAYLTAVFIIGCCGPGIMAAIFWLIDLVRRARTGRQ